MDDALNEVIALLDEPGWTWAERRVIEARLRWLLDLRSEYVTPEEQLAITLDEVEPIGTTATRPVGALVGGWLRRPKPVGPQCRWCDGTGQDDRLVRRQRVGGPKALVDTYERLDDALFRLANVRPDLQWTTDWFAPARELVWDFLQRHEVSNARVRSRDEWESVKGGAG